MTAAMEMQATDDRYKWRPIESLVQEVGRGNGLQLKTEEKQVYVRIVVDRSSVLMLAGHAEIGGLAPAAGSVGEDEKTPVTPVKARKRELQAIGTALLETLHATPSPAKHAVYGRPVAVKSFASEVYKKVPEMAKRVMRKFSGAQILSRRRIRTNATPLI